MESYFAVTSAASQRAIQRMPGLEDRRAGESWLTEASAGRPSADVHVGGVPRGDPWSTPAATARRTITPTINPAMNPPRTLKTTEYAATVESRNAVPFDREMPDDDAGPEPGTSGDAGNDR